MGKDTGVESIYYISTHFLNDAAMKNVARIKQCSEYLETEQHFIVVVGGSIQLSP